MTADLTIYEQKFVTSNGVNQIIMTCIAEVHNSELIKELEELGMQNWYINGESGAEFEIQGSDLKDFADKIKEKYKNFKEDELQDEEWYRCSLAY